MGLVSTATKKTTNKQIILYVQNGRNATHIFFFYQRQVIAQTRQSTLDQHLVQYFILAHR